MTHCPLRSMVRATWGILEFHTLEISLQRLKLESSNCVCLQAMSNVSLRVTWSIWEFYTPLNFSGTVKFFAWVGLRSINLVMTNCPPSGRGQCHVTSFWQIIVNISKTCKTEIYLQWKTTRISCMAYQMAATAVTLNDLEGHSQVADLFKCNPSNICAAFYTISTDSVLARSHCVSWTSCMNQETTDKRIVYARNTEIG